LIKFIKYHIIAALELAAPIQLLAAPVLHDERYQGQPVYFSDLVLRADARYQAFTDLRGATLAYDEPHSYSGYLVLRALDAELIEELRHNPHILSYSSLELPDGSWGNLVIMRSPQGAVD